MSDPQWSRVTKEKPCPACGEPDWCAWAPDGNLKCERESNPPAGMRRLNFCEGGAIFKYEDQSSTSRSRERSMRPPSKPVKVDEAVHRQLEEVHARAVADVKAEELEALATALGVTVASLRSLEIGWISRDTIRQLGASGKGWNRASVASAWVFPERDGSGRIVGFSLRAADGKKGSPSGKAGCRRGLIIPNGLADLADPVLVVEGATDVAACLTQGIAAVGRPSNASGADMLAELLAHRDVLVVGENDLKETGKWPGREGAIAIAMSLATSWRKAVGWSLPPEPAKDIREVLRTCREMGLDMNCAVQSRKAGEALVSELQSRRDIVDLIEDRRNDIGVVRAEVEGLMDRATKEPKVDANSIRAPKERGSARMEFKPVPIEELGPSLPPDWVWTGFAAKGFTTLLTGMWKGGKSTLVGWLLHDLIHGGGLIPNPSNIKTLIISEESSAMWARRRDDLKLNNSVHLSCRPFKGKPTKAEWFETLKRIAEHVRTDKYDLVIFDTLGSLWPLENENDAAEVMSVILPTHEITAAGAALILIHHPRKGDGPEGQGSRGSGALPSDADILVELHCHAPGNAKDRRRVLKCRSRFDETPPETVLELQDDGYIVLGDKAETNHADRKKIIEGLLPADPPGKTVEELVTAWPTKPAPGKRTIAGDLEHGVNDGKWDKKGDGVKNDPVRYFLKPKFDSRRDPPLSARMESNGGGDAVPHVATVQKPRRSPRRSAVVAGEAETTEKPLGGAA